MKFNFIDRICPNSSVWEENMFSLCFADLVFGCGSNVITLILVAGIKILLRDGTGRLKVHLPVRFIVGLPALGACVSFLDMVLTLWKLYDGDGFLYHDLIYKCSQLSVWTTILLLSRCDAWYYLCCSRILCCWWIVKPILQVPHLQTILSSYPVWLSFKDCLNFLLDVAFGICINIVRIRKISCNRNDNQLEDSLLSHDLEEGHPRNSGIMQSLQNTWTLMTFSSIKSIMDTGVTKQLDFDELLNLPLDMDPSSCHNFLLTCWQAQQIDNCSNPSFFKAICSAYGWPYFRLGLLKVFNDCIGFAGPLLLNKLIKFLQQGTGGADGFVLAVSLGLASVLKYTLVQFALFP